jgi:hypothetical protein
MDQIITLLTNLFNLTKVASVTLPGLLAAGGLALVLWPTVPIDVIPVVTAVSPSSQSFVVNNEANPLPPRVNPSKEPSNEPASTFPPAFGQACSVEFWPLENLDSWIEWAIKNPGRNGLRVYDPVFLGNELDQLKNIRRNPSIPENSKRRIFEQFVLDLQDRNLALCVDLEKSWQGQEEKDIQPLNTDADILEKQRSAAQDNYLAYQKSNSPLAHRYEAAMDEAKARIDTVRNTIRGKDRDVQERMLRVKELNEDQQLITDRLKDPGRLRPRVGFDAFATGLVNHVVAFILLSLAMAIVVTAIDRAALSAFFENVFDGF